MKIDLIIVASNKDFSLLEKCVSFAVESLGELYSKNIFIVVPSAFTSTCIDFLPKEHLTQCIIVNEEDLLDVSDRQKLKMTFGNRYGWSLQQILKVAQALKMLNQYALVVDCDTFLIKKRNWLCEKKQLLLASWEYHEAYYSFLSDLGVCERRPEFTFVTHHMLINRSYLEEALRYIGVETMSKLVELICARTNNVSSPFCVDYELYGQYLFKFHRANLRLEKWSNISVTQNSVSGLTLNEIRHKFPNHASISCHSYL